MIAEAFASVASAFGAKPSRRNASIENPRYSLDSPELYEMMAAGHQSASGVTVTHEGSLALSAVWQSLSLISGDGSKLPLYPYKRLPDDDRDIADKHPSYIAVAVRANAEKSAKRFWSDLIVHLLLWRNAYAYINRTGQRLELYNLLPDRTAPRWIKVPDSTSRGGFRAQYIFETEVDGKLEVVLPRNMLHVRHWSLDGVTAPDLVKAAKDAWGLALASQNFESKFFKNGARKGGILELPSGMPKPARDTLEEGFRKAYEGGDNPFKTVILRDGAKFHDGQVTPEQGQVIELDEKQKREVASYFNIPPSKLGIRDSVSYNSFEQDNLSYLHGCLHHVCDAISDECDMKLLSEPELIGDTHYFEHNYSQFIQADWKTLNEGLEIMRRNEIINADEWRRKLNMNKRPDGGGNEYINPNTKPAPAAESAPDDKATPPPKKKNRAAFAGLLNDTLGRMARRVGFDARQSAKSPAKFQAWIDEGAQEHRRMFDEAMNQPLATLVAIAEGDASTLNVLAAGEFFDGLLTELAPLLNQPNIAAELEQNVNRAMNYFERHAPERVTARILEAQ
jgi:HK97 family phage portal protein